MISTGAAAQQTAEIGLFFSGIKRKKQAILETWTNSFGHIS